MYFRTANLNDLSELQALEQCVVEAERPFNPSIKSSGAHYYDIEALISSDDSCMLLAEDANQIVGTGYAKIRKSKPSMSHEIESYLGFMYVSPEYRGQGLNKDMIERLISWSRDQGANDLYLDVYPENVSAINAYKKVGFSPSMVEMKLSL